jgi:hypothetical protein
MSDLPLGETGVNGNVTDGPSLRSGLNPAKPGMSAGTDGPILSWEKPANNIIGGGAKGETNDHVGVIKRSKRVGDHIA